MDGRAYSNDLRERVVRAVINGGLSRLRRRPNLGCHQHGDQLGTALPGDQQRQAGPNRRLSAKEDCGPHRERLMVPEGFYRTQAGGRTR